MVTFLSIKPSGFLSQQTSFLVVQLLYVKNDYGMVKTVKRNQPIERQKPIIKERKKNCGARTVRSIANEKKR